MLKPGTELASYQLVLTRWVLYTNADPEDSATHIIDVQVLQGGKWVSTGLLYGGTLDTLKQNFNIFKNFPWP